MCVYNVVAGRLMLMVDEHYNFMLHSFYITDIA